MYSVNYVQCVRCSFFGVAFCSFNIVAISGNAKYQTGGELLGGGRSNGN